MSLYCPICGDIPDRQHHAPGCRYGVGKGRSVEPLRLTTARWKTVKHAVRKLWRRPRVLALLVVLGIAVLVTIAYLAAAWAGLHGVQEGILFGIVCVAFFAVLVLPFLVGWVIGWFVAELFDIEPGVPAGWWRKVLAGCVLMLLCGIPAGALVRAELVSVSLAIIFVAGALTRAFGAEVAAGILSGISGRSPRC